MTFRISVLCCVAVLAASAVCEAAIIRVNRVATVDSALVKLGDLADVISDDDDVTEQLNSVTLGLAPMPGNSQILKLDEITERLRQRGINLADVEFQGVATVQVNRTAEQLEPAPHTLIHKTNRQEVIRAAGSESKHATDLNQSTSHSRLLRKAQDVSVVEMRQAEAIVETIVRQFLNEHAADWGQPHINALLTTTVVPILLHSEKQQVDIVSARPIPGTEGLFFLTLAVPTPTGPVETAPVRVQIVRRPRIVVTRRLIDRGQIIREADLKFLEVDDVGSGVTELSDLIGKQAKQSIRPDVAIRADSVEKPELVKRGSEVLVVAHVAGLKIERRYRAKSGGGLDDLIEVETLDPKNRQSLSAIVSGPGTAQPASENSAEGSY